MRASDFVPAGMSLQDSGGEVSSPSQVYLRGILPPFPNTDDLMLKAMVLPAALDVPVSSDFCFMPNGYSVTLALYERRPDTPYNRTQQPVPRCA